MKVCYLDESGTGDEPIAIVVGIIADAQRMHITKEHWVVLLNELSAICGTKLKEIHTKDFYRGNGAFRSMAADKRVEYTHAILRWISDRKHDVVYSAVDKRVFAESRSNGTLPTELSNPWRAAAFHCVLAVQRAHQKQSGTKGHTLLVFDEKLQEQKAFAELVLNPPEWSDRYYGRGKKQAQMSHVIDAPYFADSEHVALIQVADFVAYFLRRHVELAEGHQQPKYAGEEARFKTWAKQIASRTLVSHMYPSKGRNCEMDVFYRLCPASIRRIGA